MVVFMSRSIENKIIIFAVKYQNPLCQYGFKILHSAFELYYIKTFPQIRLISHN